VARALYDLRARNVHAFGAQGLEAETPGVVRAEAPRVCRAKPEPLQPRQRGGRLPARAALVRDEPRLRIELRVGRDDDEVVNGVEAESHGVELSGGRGLDAEPQSCSPVEGL